MLELSIDNKKFITAGNESGLSSEETIFQYFENDSIVYGFYKGGAIIEGQIVGKRIHENQLELLFQSVTEDGELKSGQSTGVISRNEEGKITLSFEWNWLNGDLSGGKSFYIEKG
jgi:hypothetical protein